MITRLNHDLIPGRFPIETSPVVLACIKKGNESKELVSMLEQFSSEMDGRVRVFIADEEVWSKVRNEFKLEGTPVLIFYFQKREQCRILGNTTSQYLRTAVQNILCSSKKQEMS